MQSDFMCNLGPTINLDVQNHKLVMCNIILSLPIIFLHSEDDGGAKSDDKII